MTKEKTEETHPELAKTNTTDDHKKDSATSKAKHILECARSSLVYH